MLTLCCGLQSDMSPTLMFDRRDFNSMTNMTSCEHSEVLQLNVSAFFEEWSKINFSFGNDKSQQSEM